MGRSSAPPSPTMTPILTVPTHGDDDDAGADMFDLTAEEDTRSNRPLAVGEDICGGCA